MLAILIVSAILLWAIWIRGRQGLALATAAIMFVAIIQHLLS